MADLLVDSGLVFLTPRERRVALCASLALAFVAARALTTLAASWLSLPAAVLVRAPVAA